jgi:hypothetical protein
LAETTGGKQITDYSAMENGLNDPVRQDCGKRNAVRDGTSNPSGCESKHGQRGSMCMPSWHLPSQHEKIKK